jgi:hypothetical protein
MLLFFRLAVFIAAIQGVFSLKCYGYVPGANSTIVIGIQDSSATPGICTNPSCACASYMFQCSNNARSCSTQQLQNQTIIWNYVLTSNTTCQQLAITPTTTNITCCYTDLCNNQAMSTILTTVTGVINTTPRSSTSLLSLSIWVVLLPLCFALG